MTRASWGRRSTCATTSSRREKVFADHEHLRRPGAARRTRQRGVRAARALHESADAADPAHDRLRSRLRAGRGCVPLRSGRREIPRLSLRFRRLRPRPLPSGYRAGAPRRDRVGASESRADGMPATLRTPRRGARRADAQRLVPLLLHEQRCGIGGDRSQVRTLRDGSRSCPIRRSRVSRSHDRRVGAERRPRVP